MWHRHLPVLVASACMLGLSAVALAESGPRPPSSDAAIRPLTLEQARMLALQNHPALAAANYRADAEQQVEIETRAGLLPQVALVGSAAEGGADNTRILAGGLNNPSVMDRTAGGVLVSQLLTDFGHTTNLLASSTYKARAAEQDVAATRAQVLLQADAAYFGVLQAQAVQNVTRQTVDTRQLLLDRVSVLARNKLKSDLDVNFARVALENSQLLLESARNGVENAMATLSAALGLKQPEQFRLAEVGAPGSGSEESADIGALIDQALRDRPDLESLRDQLDAALRYARAERDARLPTISAVGAAGAAISHDPRLPANYTAGGIEISIPLFTGGLFRAREHAAEFQAKALGESLRDAQDSVGRDVRIALSNLMNARERLHTTQQLVETANEAYELAQARYQVGASSIVELSQAQLQQTTAQIDAATARYEVFTRRSVLQYQLGELAAVDRNALP
ncbi:MAG: TolC family protein [Steroidobacteraceae bacterium]